MPKLIAREPGSAWKNGFFSTGSSCRRADIAVGYKQFAAAIEADPANAIKPVENDATMAARETAQLAILELFVEIALSWCRFRERSSVWMFPPAYL